MTYLSIYFHTFRIWGAHIIIHHPVFPAPFGAKDHCCVRCSVGVPQSAVVPATTVWALACGTAWLVCKTLRNTKNNMFNYPFWIRIKLPSFSFIEVHLPSYRIPVSFLHSWLLPASFGLQHTYWLQLAGKLKSRCSSSRNTHHTSIQILLEKGENSPPNLVLRIACCSSICFIEDLNFHPVEGYIVTILKPTLNITSGAKAPKGPARWA